VCINIRWIYLRPYIKKVGVDGKTDKSWKIFKLSWISLGSQKREIKKKEIKKKN
jgi:hypothetical protein